jgi:hypothetical protein
MDNEQKRLDSRQSGHHEGKPGHQAGVADTVQEMLYSEQESL